MTVLVIGSIALDSLETPFGTAENVLGGAGSYFSLAASTLTPVQLVGVVGSDLDERHLDTLRSHGVDLQGLQRVENGKTFRWQGHYEYDLNVAHTLDTHLNVFAGFQPKLSEGSKNSRLVFLGNIQPDLQRGVRAQTPNAELVALDTMNLWIDTTRDSLQKTIEVVDLLIINDAEARQLAGEPNLIKAARKILSWGPSTLIVKRGEYGAAMFTKETYFAIPAYPLEAVFDPTGAGDTFAGGLMGYLASQEKLDEAALRRAMIFGSVMASFNVEEFGSERVQRLTADEINQRFRDFKRFTHFEEIPFEQKVSSSRFQVSS